MNFEKLNEPQKLDNLDLVNGLYVPPLGRLKLMSSDDFEDMISEWAYGYLSQKYVDVQRIGGAGDQGRDVIAYITDDRQMLDIYQCKHYSSALTPAKMWVEFGKLVFYTFTNEYRIPVNYYIVTSMDISTALIKLIESPEKIGSQLIANWEKHCKKKITSTKSIELSSALRKYIENFDFSIVKSISPIKLIDEYSKTKWYKYRFGEIKKKKPKRIISVPEELNLMESQLPYVIELVKVYKECSDECVSCIEDLKNDPKFNAHFIRQRKSYYSAQALMRFSRDEYLGEPYNDVKEELLFSVIDVCQNDYETSFKRVNDTLSEARRIPIENEELGTISTIEKAGVCHDLVNDGELKWVIENE